MLFFLAAYKKYYFSVIYTANYGEGPVPPLP